MRQIINGKLYSTDSATLKAYWDTEDHDLGHKSSALIYGCKREFVAHSLYRTHSGEYFLWITEMATNTNKLEVLNEESLMDWLECYDYSDAEIAKILDVELA